MHYRSATPADADRIAALHARSWQETYRGILPDLYLDSEVVAERLAYWQEQFQQRPANRSILVAETDGQLAGFACTVADHDPIYGALLDNLHVASANKGQGIGRALIRQSAEWVRGQNPASGFYLWVYETNHAARKVYDGLGAVNQEAVPGEHAVMLRYVWPDLPALIAALSWD